MTELYDVLSAWPVIGNGSNLIPYQRAKLAMGVKAGNMHHRLGEIQPHHWRGLAASAAPDAWSQMTAMAKSVEAVVAEVEAGLPGSFPLQVWRSVNAGLKRYAAVFLNGVPEGA